MIMVLYVSNPVAIKSFFETMGLEFVEEKHVNGPVHYACSVNDNVFEVYPASDKWPVGTLRVL